MELKREDSCNSDGFDEITMEKSPSEMPQNQVNQVTEPDQNDSYKKVLQT
jgi:hypothetical protein